MIRSYALCPSELLHHREMQEGSEAMLRALWKAHPAIMQRLGAEKPAPVFRDVAA